MSFVLAATELTASIIISCLILLAMVIIGFFVVSWVKKRVQQPEDPVSMGFSLAELRDLVKSGQITPQEFERARGRMMASAKQEKPKQSDQKTA